ncbi:unnamed protein product [Brassica oleracea var. botrytis]|uniref:Uncharacterized protein n=2 Tax=Brassica TaxID=3705 RepID=A0A3P6AUN2_BRAOL|nr:unnamed protein product [Brassica napus]CDY11789.1 BnaC03g57890D [Brassica napus]VDC97726.1 unnamed protein product [Brassica oleracea]
MLPISEDNTRWSFEMGQLVHIRSGRWEKTGVGSWKFEPDSVETGHYIVARTNETIDSFKTLVRDELGIGHLIPLLLTYQLAGCMAEGDPACQEPTNLLTSEDIEIMMSVKEWNNEVQICVTYGALNVSKYQFLCRTSFTIGETTYLDDGVTEAENCSMITDMVGDDEIRCAGSVLKQLSAYG